MRVADFPSATSTRRLAVRTATDEAQVVDEFESKARLARALSFCANGPGAFRAVREIN
jgi:hypothetical protein